VCTDCEANNCPHDATGCSDPTTGCTVQPACSDYTTAAAVSSCNAVLDCARSTNCIALGNVNCYCGPGVDIVSCKSDAANAQGACKATITAAFPAGANATTIVNGLGDVSQPGGGAMALAECDHDFCGSPGLGGNQECVPYCK
jgi:hypothetical protein